MKLRVRCRFCNGWFSIDLDKIEEFMYSDPHDPDCDYLKCPKCGKLMDITDEELKGGLLCVLEKDGTLQNVRLVSDAVDMYLYLGDRQLCKLVGGCRDSI